MYIYIYIYLLISVKFGHLACSKHEQKTAPFSFLLVNTCRQTDTVRLCGLSPPKRVPEEQDDAVITQVSNVLFYFLFGSTLQHQQIINLWNKHQVVLYIRCHIHIYINNKCKLHYNINKQSI